MQLALLNAEWERIRTSVPHYRREIERGALPRRFGSLAEFVAAVPPTTRRDVQLTLPERTSSERSADFRRITGGSTAEPVQLPAWSSEQTFTRADMWWGRSWYGINPGSRLFMLWGHSHLLGTGAAGWWRARRLEWSDRLLGYHRHSAYDMRPERLRAAADAMLRFRPDYVLGYSVALARFAAANVDRSDALRSLGLRAVIGAAEGFPSPEAEGQVASVLGAPVAMEYGSVETGLIGHTHPEGGYRVFWRSYLLDVEPHRSAWRVRVTSLYPRSFPLIRYDIGDEVELFGDATGAVGLTRIARVAGRCNDYVDLEDGTVVHSEAFTHVMRPCAEVRAYQIVGSGASLRIVYVADALLSPEAETGIRGRLSRIHPGLARIPVERVPDVQRTTAGKTRMVVPG